MSSRGLKGALKRQRTAGPAEELPSPINSDALLSEASRQALKQAREAPPVHVIFFLAMRGCAMQLLSKRARDWMLAKLGYSLYWPLTCIMKNDPTYAQLSAMCMQVTVVGSAAHWLGQ